jgi:predicted alpha/beta-hydrolase family hydrolase
MATSDFKIQVTDAASVHRASVFRGENGKESRLANSGSRRGRKSVEWLHALVRAGLAERGLDVVTFNFLYTEQGRKIPDPAPRLESCYRAVIDAVVKHKKLKGNRLVIGGKSMGGRIASQVAASQPADIDGLVFLGYPLHPPGRPDKLRSEHLPKIKAPMLFVQGSRDAFGTGSEIETIIKKLKLRAELYSIDGGDHSLKVPKTSGLSQIDAYRKAMDEVVEWTNRALV